MKKINCTVFVAIFLFSILNAKDIGIVTAQRVAGNFYKASVAYGSRSSEPELTLVYECKRTNPTATGEKIYYVFNVVGENGFVIVAGDDKVTPVLGYSNESAYDPSNLPPAFKKWMEEYRKQIEFLKENLSENEAMLLKWQEYESGNLPHARSSGAVNPLIQTKWNQSPYYNNLCPGGSVTGCVATAMAQVMKYWNHPVQGSGFHSYNTDNYGTLSANFGSTTYDWANMPNQVTSSSTNAQKSAVATLMYHCGVSVDMNYSPDVSGAYVIEDYNNNPPNCAEYAYKTYFGYSNCQGIQRKDYGDNDWIQIMKDELDASRPILHAGFGSGGGHAFVCDGYDNNDYFHFNWGWGGQEDGYFWIDALNPGSLGTGGGSGGYNSNQQIIIGIEPDNVVSPGTDLILSSVISFSPDPISYFQAFNVTANIYNAGSSSFNGDVAAALFDDEGNFIDIIDGYTNVSIGAGSSSGIITFSNSGMSALPGDYLVGIFFKPANGEWSIIDEGSYYNPEYALISAGSPDIQLYSNLQLNSTTIIQGQNLTVTADIANYGTTDFTGYVAAYVFNLDGSAIEAIAVLSGTIEANTYTPGTFGPYQVNLEPGTYKIATAYSVDDIDYYFIGDDDYLNVANVVVVEPPIVADVYENNNTEQNAYNFSLNFSGNTASFNTNGTNIHIGSDYDYFKASLPSGFDYVVTARVHDSYNSGNGNTYTDDVLFSYNTGAGWSEAYDDVIPTGSFTVGGGNTLYLWIAPYFQGETGSYLLDVSITRTASTGTDNVSSEESLKIFPNPANNVLNVTFPFYEHRSIKIFNALGQQLQEMVTENDRHNKLDVSGLENGLYNLQVISGSKSTTTKFIINK